MTIILAERAVDGDTALPVNLGALMPDWMRSSRAVGGYWRGVGTITQATRGQMVDWYNRWIGHQMIEYALGREAWRGYISELRLTLNGVEYFQSMAPEWFANYIQVVYSTTIATRDETDVYSDADSIATFGRRELIRPLGGATSAGAEALAQTLLEQFAWPRSRMSGGFSVTQTRTGAPDGLQVTATGFWDTLNWRHEDTSSTQEADDHVADAVTDSEFVSTGEIDTNTLSVRVDCFPNPRGWANILSEVTAQGDASFSLWQCGVYEERKLYYEQAPTTVEYYLQDGRLYNAGGSLAILPLVKPGFLLRSVGAPVGYPAPSGNVWDDPQVAYIGAVTYDRLNRSLILETAGMEEGLVVLESQIRQGNV